MKKILKNTAFTLIEVLVVTAVISLLASVVTTSVSESRTEAEDKAKIQETDQVRNALEIHKNKTGSAPLVSTAGSYVAHNEKSSTYQNAMGELVASGSMPEVPRSNSGQGYYYLVDESGNGVFGAILESDSAIAENNGCYFTDPNVGCSGDNASYEIEYNRDSLIEEGDSCIGDCDGVNDGLAATDESCFFYSEDRVSHSGEINCPLDIVIPTTIGGENVTTIAGSGFASENLTSVTIPDTVIYIEGSAFVSNQLTSVTIPDNVIDIGAMAFMDNPLTSVSISSKTSYVSGDPRVYWNSFGSCSVDNGCITLRP